jgi:hypothetical protein
LVIIKKKIIMETENRTTLGERRVRTDFNVNGGSLVDHFKSETASLINSLETMRELSEVVSGGNISLSAKAEKQRLISLAQTAYEEAAMWAVKAATF